MAYLQIHPKVYWIWNHRKWCLEHVPLGPATLQASAEEAGHDQGNNDEAEGEQSEEMTEGWRIGFWKGELAVIEALLDADPRNCMSPPPLPS
jgi:geranylgeranyl transferase type-2 subunit alpha